MCHPPSPIFLSPQAYFFVAPSEARGPSALARLEMTSRDAVPIEVRDVSLLLDMTGLGCHPRAYFFVAPSASERSLGACAPREDFTMRLPERSEEGRRPERSEGCTAYAQQDKVGDFFEQPQGTFKASTQN